MASKIEYEAKILNIDIEKLIKQIELLGGKVSKELLFRRYVFDIVPAEKGKWVRLRSDGTLTTLTYKQISSKEISGTSEWEVEVSDFDTTLEILKSSGLTPKGYQENRRIECTLNGAELAIDSWPKLSPYLEIEAKDEEAVISIAKTLGYTKTDLTAANTIDLYSEIGINLDQIEDLRFE